MTVMHSGKGRAIWSGGLSRILLLAALAGLWFPWSGTAQEWDTEAADSALKEARELKNRLSADQQAGTNDFLRCIHLYKRVYLSDPHFNGSDDAIYEAATLYQEMAARFKAPEYDKEAAQMLRFLIKDYPLSQLRPYATLRLAAMGPAQAVTPASALRVPTQQRATGGVVQTESKAGTASVGPTVASEVKRAALVRSIRHITTAESARVTIALDARVPYEKVMVENPDRIFFDIPNARLGPDASGEPIVVKDQALRRVRAAENRPGVVRVVLDLRRGADCAVSEMSDPFRIVIDVRRNAGPTTAQKISH